MESEAVGLDPGTSPDPRVQPDCSVAHLRRQAWAKSRDSIWQEAQPETCGLQGSQRSQGDSAGTAQRPSEEPGHVPNKITSWLIECRTPPGASLDDQSASPSRGALRNVCSFEDDLSLGAEANHLQPGNKKAVSCFGLVADQKRSQYKERGRSMNSTGSGKSSTVSSVSELLDLYEEDPEEVLLNLGFGRDEPDLSSKIPSRFFNSSSSARGIDIKVYLGAQLQRMEVENPNYALTSRFRQIQVLTTVANEFFQLYSQVSGQHVQRISCKEQGGEGQEGGKEAVPTPSKKSSSALNAAKLLKKTITKHNLLNSNPELSDAHTPQMQTQLNGHSGHILTNGDSHTSLEQDVSSIGPDHQVETVNQKHIRKKDNCSLATVTEETNGDGETDQLTDHSPEQRCTEPPLNEEPQPEGAGFQSTNQRTEDQAIREKIILTSTPEKPPPSLAPPQLAQLRTENTDSFDMEEIQSNDDEALLPRTSRNSDLLRTVSQQSDSSGFAEEPSVDSSYLKVQESSDSCDSETTVTSHPSQDVATPLALDQQAFDLIDVSEKEMEPDGAADTDEKISSKDKDGDDESSEQVPHYIAHQLPKSKAEEQHHQTRYDGHVETGRLGIEEEPQPELEHTQNLSIPEQEPEHTQKRIETAVYTETPIVSVGAEDKAQVGNELMDLSLCPPVPSSPVLSALNRAKQNHLSREGQQVIPQPSETNPIPSRGRERGSNSLQRSSSLPSSFLSPSRVVSSVRIQFGRGHTSFTRPRYSFKYSKEARSPEDEEGQTSCLSTLIINPASSSGSCNQPSGLPTETPTPTKPIPRYLMQSSQSLHSPSPPPGSLSGHHVLSWSTQSVPDLSSTQQPFDQFQQGMMSQQQQQSLNPGQIMFPYRYPTAHYINTPSPGPSPNCNPNPYPFTLNPPPQYPTPHHNLSLTHHSSLTSLYQPITSTLPQHSSLSNLHQPSTSTVPHHINLPPGTPIMHHHGYSHSCSHQSPQYSTPESSMYASPYLGCHGYSMNPHLAFPHPHIHFSSMASEHSSLQVQTPPAPGFPPGMSSGPGLGHSLHPRPTSPAVAGPHHIMSSTEMQLRRVLHDIRGTVQSLNQNRAETPDVFTDQRAAPPSPQALTEFQQKRQSLNLFRCQMMDLELSIIRQQALVYKHLSPADRLEVEQLQSLRAAVREELQELEQQLEDRLMELTQHTPHKGLHRGSSIDSLSTASALRAMEPVSDLLREQLFLQSELSYVDHVASTEPSSRSSSPVRDGGGSEQRPSMYRACINITPTPPPRPNTHAKKEDEEEATLRNDKAGVEEVPEEERPTGELRVENLQHLIREIRESVAEEVRREIYSELMAAVSPRGSLLPTRQHPL
ncbi:protein ITPRID2 [Aulostomus maculatus]